MQMDDTQILRETQFNAGVDIALNISRLFKEAEYFASTGNYQMWHIKLEAIERRMWTKFRQKKEAKEELETIESEGEPFFRKYILKDMHGKKMSKALIDDVKLFLTTYEKSLIFWRDKFGYGMPMKDDPRFALG